MLFLKMALVTVILHHALEFQKVYGFDRLYSSEVRPKILGMTSTTSVMMPHHLELMTAVLGIVDTPKVIQE